MTYCDTVRAGAPLCCADCHERHTTLFMAPAATAACMWRTCACAKLMPCTSLASTCKPEISVCWTVCYVHGRCSKCVHNSHDARASLG